MSPAAGEVALFRNDRFADADSVTLYVAWGEPGHSWSSVATEADLWTPDGFETISPLASGLVAVTDHPETPSDWAWTVPR